MIQINCDIGEKGPLHEGDRKLMEFIHIANLACEGHAGDRESVEAFRALAARRGVGLSAHLSYPDKENFGRASMALPEADLLAALDAQLSLLPGVKLVKFHGALYNDAWSDARLADLLAGWLMRSGINGILAPADSELAAAARRLGITVLREAFADRRYAWDAEGGRLRLASRAEADAAISGVKEALAQAEEIARRGRVNVSCDPEKPDWREIKADTVCIHSDSPIALELAEALRAALDAAEKAAAAAGVRGNMRLVKPGFCGTAGLPAYGRQHLAVSPGGAMDCFSLRRGNLMLGNPEGSQALEIVGPPEIEILTPGRFVLTGAKLQAFLRRGADEPAEVEHSRVYEVEAGDKLAFGEKRYGLYTYFCFRGRAGGGTAPEGAVPFSAVNGWADPQGRIRVLPGPEYGFLKDPEQFFFTQWHTTFKMDKMGMRLAGEPGLKCDLGNMVSAAVADGTVQLTPDGPIVLLRHRQTTGGYPRIFNVITADIDLLGQYGPNQQIHFVQVTREEAVEFARQKEKALGHA
ncbi:MAG: LamB/YcsF family protein [Elusimicrobiales bacterium]|nr:LamB/YcsF family protein [Elusimicrobiales bacterium]